MQREILDKIEALPGVTSVGFAGMVPMHGLQSNGPVAVEGQTVAAGDQPPQRRWINVAPGYFETIGTGRDVHAAR